MNFSVYNTDRATHLKIVVTTLVASTAIVALVLSARIHDGYLLAARQLLPSGLATALKTLASGDPQHFFDQNVNSLMQTSTESFGFLLPCAQGGWPDDQ